MRNLPKVIEKMLAVIPQSEEIVVHELQKISRSSDCASPEMQPHWWSKVALCMSEHMAEKGIEEVPAEGWLHEVQLIFADKK